MEPLLPDYIAHGQRRFKEAVNRFNRESPTGPHGIFSGLFAFHWLHREIHPLYKQAILNASRNPDHDWLTTLLAEAANQEDFVNRFMAHHGSDAHPTLLTPWQNSQADAVRQIQRQQKEIAGEVGGSCDRERLALVDALPPQSSRPKPWPKAGFIPRLACSQSCRHCMFVYRTPLRHFPDPTLLLQTLNQQTTALLFTGGDLSDQMPLFHQAIQQMDRIHSFAILLNGVIATSQESANSLFADLEQAQNSRSQKPPEITLQISFDEFHQEILANRDGSLKERVPIANIANLIISAIDHPTIRLVLLHKQNRLNFSTELFKRGVFARLARELARRGHTLRILHHAPSPRIKNDPVDPSRFGNVTRDALFVLDAHPSRPIHFMSSTIDAYGRAALLDPSEFIHERPLLQEILQHGPPPGERFDTDPMIRIDGEVTCFSASPVWLGNLYESDKEIILARLAKDPLLRALERFDPRLLKFYQEVAYDLEHLLDTSTGPHHLFYRLTERGSIRLHMTQRLLKNSF
ncbi:MAG: hypothetical protein HQL93_09480 [Magnetococcales bacterium]|nr:hypothetical protein [Magnetococcales bacterium]